MRIKLIRAICKPPWPEVWSGMVSVALTIALLLTFLPMQVSVNTDGILSISLRQASANPDWLSGWDQRVKLTTDNTDITSSLSDFPVLIYLSTSSGRNAEDISFVFDELQSDANRFKIAVTTSDGVTQCYVEIEKWDDANEKAWLWVKAPSVSNITDTDLYLYYDSSHADNTAYVGDPNSTPAENVWDSNFKFVSHMRDAAPSGDCFANNGMSQPFNGVLINPGAYYYNGKTYAAWQGGSNNDPYIDCYDHATGTWHGKVKVGTNPLTDDSHGRPAVIVDNSGYIHVFFGSHNTALKYSKSTNTEDVSAWTAQTDIGSACAYPNVVKADGGTLYLFLRENVSNEYEAYYRKSTDFTTAYKIIEVEAINDRVYYSNAELDSTNDRIHIAWNYYDASETGYTYREFNIYHAYLKISDGHMYSMNGTDLGTTITYAEAEASCKIVDSGSYEVGRPVLHLDSNEYPYIIHQLDSATDINHKFIRWNGSVWSSDDTITISGQTNNRADFIINGSSNIDAYLITAPADVACGDLEKWHWNGSSWSKTSTILAKTDVEYDGLNSPQVVVNGVSGLQCVVCDTDAEVFTHWDLEVFAIDSSGEFVHNGGDLDTSHIRDSTSNNNDGTKKGAAEPAVTISGAIDDAQHFDASDDYIGLSDDSFEADSQGTIEAWIKRDTASRDYDIIFSSTVPTAKNLAVFGVHEASGYNLYIQHYIYGDHSDLIYGNTVLGTGEHHVVLTSSGTAWALYVDGAAEGLATLLGSNTGDWFADLAAGTHKVRIGQYTYDTTNHYYFDGIIDEVRISNIARSAAWIKASYESGRDHLLDWGSEEGINPEITNTPDTWSIGIVAVGSSSNTTIDYFAINNTGNCPVDITIQGTNLTAGDDTWELSADATPGENIYGLMAGLDDGDDLFDTVVNLTANTFVTNLAEAVTQDWGLNLSMPTSLSGFDGNNMTGTITLVASAA